MNGSFKVTNNTIAKEITHIVHNFGIRAVAQYEEVNGERVLKSMRLVSIDLVSDKGSVGNVIKKEI